MQYDAIVIGGSFAGLSATMQLARARRRVLLIDAGTPRNRFAKTSHGFLGQDGKTPAEIVVEGRRQLSLYPSVEFVDGEAAAAKQTDTGFEIRLGDGRVVTGSRLVLATGVRDELPSIPGMESRWGVSVLHCPYCHGYEVADRPLGVLATTPSSTHQALLVSDWGPVTYFTQGIYEPDAEQLAQLSARGVRIERSSVVELLGAGSTLEAVRLVNDETITLNAIFVAPRTHMASDLPAQLGLAFEEGHTGPLIRVDEQKQTSVPGVFAAGDASSPMANATIASAAGVMAGVAAHRSLIFE